MIIDKGTIQKAKKKLGDKNAFIIAEELHVEKFDEKNLKSLCPFHEEDTPSFVYNKKNFTMHCFGCGKTVDVVEALMSSGRTFIEAIQILFEKAGIKYNFGEHNVKTRRLYRYPYQEPLNSKEQVYSYLSSRSISAATADYLDIRQDGFGNCVFNYYDTNDVLTMVKYRPSHKVDKKKKESKSWCQKNADTTPLLFNMNRINTTAPLLITEGELDCAAAIESGYLNTVSVPLGAHNYHWIEECWDWLEQFDSIILCADNDEAGNDMRNEVVNRLGAWRTQFVEIPFEIEGKKVKDLNELLFYSGKEAVLNVILNAKETPVDSVIDFTEVQSLDLSEMDGIQTGFKELDKSLFKLFYGTFNVLTGINGSGKSSFLTQIICQCLDDDKNVFMYSGELPNGQAKNWIDTVFAGRRNVNKYQYEDSEIVYYRINKAAQAAINSFYKGRLFLYKDEQSHSVEAILKTMEATVRKYGCKLLVIDNLTSVSLGTSGKDKWERQEEFIKSLITFANKFHVVVVLVVHPHKTDTVRRLTKMDVQGTSATIDLAHRILSLYRVQEKDRNWRKQDGREIPPIAGDVVCDILKDRLRGYEGQSVSFYYDQPSRRFFKTYEDLDHHYKWDTTDYTGIPDPHPVPQLEQEPF